MASYRLSWFTLGATLLLVLAGGLVHSTGSALACPDWPLCYGSPMPAMEGAVFYEHSHRLLGAAVGLATAVLAALLLRRWRSDRGAHRLGWIAYGAIVVQVGMAGQLGVLASRARLADQDTSMPWLILALVGGAGLAVATLAVLCARRTKDPIPAAALILGELVVFQASLGGATVLLRLPTVVSSMHLATSMLYLATSAGLVIALRPGGRARERPSASRRPVLVAAVVLYAQILLGAVVRHTGSALACNTDWFTCDGQALPATGPGWLLWSHRAAALGVVAVVWWATSGALRHAARGTLARSLALGARALVVAQVALGLLTVASFVSVGMATAHLVTGALLWIDVVALALAGRAGAPAQEPPLSGAWVGAEGAP